MSLPDWGTGFFGLRVSKQNSAPIKDRYQPITAILYTSRTGTVASVIQPDSI
jgi:hypothetical protein